MKHSEVGKHVSTKYYTAQGFRNNLLQQRSGDGDCHGHGQVEEQQQRQQHDKHESLLLLLPPELRLEIFSRLDAHSVIRLQSVCTQLRDVAPHLRSSSFPERVLTSREDPVAFAPVAFLVAKGANWLWAGYESPTKRWKWLPSFSTCLMTTDPLLYASSHGLICTLVRGTIFPITVCNPLTKQHRKLPSLTQPRCPDLLHILRDGPDSNRYRIIASGGYSLVAGEYTIIRTTECYDSSTNRWTQTRNSPQGLRLQRYQSGVFCNGFLYCLARGPQLDSLLFAYHVDSGEWVHNLGCEFLRNEEAWGGAMNAQLVICKSAIYYYEEFHKRGTRRRAFTIDELHSIAVVNPDETLSPLPEWKDGTVSVNDGFRAAMLSPSRKQGQLRRLVVEHRPLCQSRGTCVAQGNNQVCVYYPKEAKGMVYSFPTSKTTTTTTITTTGTTTGTISATTGGGGSSSSLPEFRKERLPEMLPASQYLNADLMEHPENQLQPLPWPFELSFSAQV